MIGQTLGHFTIVHKLGEGGMGEVYRAQDTKLGREVAIKVLPEAVANDPERLARFEREAKVLAALNHPNIAAIYSLESVAGFEAPGLGAGRGSEDSSVNFLVMELAQGEDLAGRLNRGAIPFEEALPIARQIAEALETAHDLGIIHRDLKPANLMLGEDGKLKVLDFGLAKALEPPPLSGEAGLQTRSPTLTAMTGANILLGTAAYMAPEQATGKQVDKRADIWAFGLVFHEMLTGRRLFAADSVPETLAGVIKSEIDFSVLPAELPDSIGRLLRRCLERDPRNRLHDIADARIVIEETLSEDAEVRLETPGSVPQVSGTRRGWRRAIPWTIASAMGILALWSLWGSKGIQSPSQARLISSSTVSRLVIPTEPLLTNERVPALAISADGKRIVYSARHDGRRHLYLREIGALEATPIDGTEGGIGPFFSPDGQRVGFAADGQLSTVAVERGPPTPLQQVSVFLGADWGADNTIVYGEWPTRLLWRIPAGGGDAQAITTRYTDITYYIQAAPRFLSGGQAVVFNTFNAFTSPGAAVVRMVSLASQDQMPLELSGHSAHYSPTGHLVFAREGSLHAARLDPVSFDLLSAPVAVLAGVLTNTSGAAQYDLSDTGTLIYIPGEHQLPEHRLVWVERDGTSTPISEEPHAFWGPRLSPDGTRVATWIASEPTHVWTYDLVRGGLTRVTSESSNFWSLWTPDGARLVFPCRNDEGNLRICWQLADRSSPAEVLIDAEDKMGRQPLSLTPDGEVLIFQKQFDPETGFDLYSKGMQDGAEQLPLLATRANEFQGHLSPDGLWLAYVSDDSGQNEVYVTPFAGTGSTIPISTQGGQEPLWAPDGKELFYRTADHVIVVDIETEPDFRASRPRILFEDRFVPGTPYGRNYDVDRTGKRFLMIGSAATTTTSTQIVVVQNWFNELNDLLGEP